MNDDIIREQNEQIRLQNEQLEALRKQMAQLSVAFGKTLTEEQRKELNLTHAGKQIDEFGNIVGETNPIVKAHKEYLEDQNRRLNELSKTITSSSNTLKESFKALTSQSDRTFGKYNSAIDQTSEALTGLAGTVFGKVGSMIAGSFIGALGTVTKGMISQYDALLKTTDELNKVGATIGITTTQFRDLAHSAGVTSKNLDVLARPLKDLSINLTSLSTNTTEGTKEFVKLTSISREQRMSYQRLGVSQEELIKNQADYITLQAVAGRNIRSEVKDRQALQRETLEYTDNLMVLANLTGQDVESIKKKQQEATKELDWQIKQFQLEEQARELDRLGRTEEAKAVRAEADARQKVLNQITGFGNEIVTKGVRSILATGTIATDEAAALARLGLSDEVEKLQSAIQRGVKAEDAAAEFQDAYNAKMRETLKNVGTAAQFSKDTGKAYGITVDSIINFNKQSRQNFVEETSLARQRVEEQKKAGKDVAKDIRATLTEAEIAAGQALDKLTGSAGFAALAVGLLGAASLGKAVGLGNIAKSIGDISKQITGLGKLAPGAVATVGTTAATTVATTATTTAATTATAAATTATTAAKTALGTLGKLAGPLTAVVGIVEGLDTAASGIKNASKELEEGKITQKEATVKKAESVGSGVGTAGGTIAGAMIGQAVIPIPILGAAIGASVGGWLGSKTGKSIGSLVGESSTTETSSKKDITPQNKNEPIQVKIINPLPVPVDIVKGLDTLKTLFDNKKVLADSSIASRVNVATKLEPLMVANQNRTIEKSIIASRTSRFDKKDIAELVSETSEKVVKKLYPDFVKIQQLSLTTKKNKNQINQNYDFEELFDFLDKDEVLESSKKLTVSFNSSDKALSALTGNVSKYNDLVEDVINQDGKNISKEIKNDLKHVAVGVNKDFQDSFKGAYLQLENFKRQFIEVTNTTMQGGLGREVPVKTETGAVVTDSSGTPIVTRNEEPLPVKQDVTENLQSVSRALNRKGIKDDNYTNAVLANIMKETGGKRVEENLNYSNTSNDRIREIFSSAKSISDAQLNEIKRDKQKMAELMYGAKSKTGKMLGNLDPGDGWKYRGRGYIQLTGRGNYAAASKAIFGDDRLLENPDLVNSPVVASEVVAWFMERNRKSMASQLGIDPNDMNQRQANLLATSQIAGRAIKPGQGYLGKELLSKVDNFSTQIAASNIKQSPQLASATPTRQPKISTSTRPLESSHQGETTTTTTKQQKTKDPVEQIQQAGLKVRPYGDVYGGGPLTENTLSVAEQIQDQIPEFKFFTSLNDKFHQKNHPSSKHARGQGLDFVLSRVPAIDESKNIKELMQKMPGVSLVKNEYYHPPDGDANQNTTGPHYHVQTSAKNGSEIDGPMAGYPVDLTAHGREVIAPLDQNKILGMLANTNVTPQTKEMFDPIISPAKNDNEFVNSMHEYMRSHRQMMEVLVQRLDSVVDELEQSNTIQDNLLKAARV